MADIFSNDTIVPDENDNAEINLDTLVGEGRKYKDPNELAKAYIHADATLERLKADQAAKDAELKVLRDITEARLNNKPADEDKTDRTINTPDPAPTPKVEVDIGKLVREELTSASEEKRKSENINTAAETMNRHFGSASKAQEAIRNRATELGVSFEWLRDVASNSPSAFFASMGINPTQRSVSSPGYSNEVNLQRGSKDKRDFAYFENIRKESPKVYYSREVQKQMFDARKELGENFYKH